MTPKSPHGALASLAAIVLISALVPLVAVPARAQAYTLGVDVSHHQNAIDWNKVAESGHVFAFHKATEGATFTDDMYATNRAQADAAGIPFGAYHFARPQGDSLAAAQADALSEAAHFLEVAQPAPGDLIPVLDMEATGGMGPTRLIAWTQSWLDAVLSSLDVRPLIYTSPNFWKTNLNDTTIFADQNFPLWIAHYTPDAPTVPAANWGGQGWSFWQWTSCASVPGISGCADEDRFRGSDLSPFMIPGAVEPQPTAGPALPPSNESPPTISGETEVGATLTASKGSWSGTHPQSYSYAWERCSADGQSCEGVINGTEPTYRLVPSDFGNRMKVRVVATNSAGSSESESQATDVVTDTTPPTPPQMIEPRSPRTLAESLEITWSQAEQGASYDVRYRRAPKSSGFGQFSSFLEGTSQSSAVVDAIPGSTYCFSARAIDQADNVSGWSAEACTNVPLDDRGFRAGSGWTRRTGSNFYLGTFTKATREGATLIVRDARVKEIHVVALKCATCGRIAVLFDGRRVAGLNLRSAGMRYEQMLHAASFASVRRGTIQLVVISNGRPVKVDGLALTIKD